jgi:hypothetical protein
LQDLDDLGIWDLDLGIWDFLKRLEVHSDALTFEGQMKDTLMVRVSGVFVLLSIGAEIAAIAVSASHGLSPAAANTMNWGVGEQLVFFQAPWMSILFSLAILAPCLSMLAWLAMYSVLAPGGPAALCGVIVTSFGFLFGMIAEMIRFSVAMTLPARYLAAGDLAKPAVLALGAFLSRLFLILSQTSFVLVFAVGMPVVALSILRSGTLSRWFGWILLVPSVLVGYVGGPLMMLGYFSIGGPFLGLGLNIFFLWFVILGIVLLRWQPTRDGLRDVSAAY